MHIREIPHMIFDRLVPEAERQTVNPRELARITRPRMDSDEIARLCDGDREVAELGGLGLALTQNSTATSLSVFLDLEFAKYERTLADEGVIGSFVAGKQVTGKEVWGRGDEFNETMWIHVPRQRFSGEDVVRAGTGYVLLGQIGILGRQIFEAGGFETTKSFLGETSLPPGLIE